MIPYARQSISEEDINAVIEVLRSDWLTQGPAVERFEAAVASYCGAACAVSTNSATSALHLAYLALGLGKGDVLWTSPNTFVATANMALHCGADVDFVDIDPGTYNLSVSALAAKLERASRQGRLPKIVVPVHFAGQPCDMAGIAALAKQYGFQVVEDASHAIGARYHDSIIGDCRYSDVTVFSFHPVKIITTGEGGMAVTNQGQTAESMRGLRSHGIVRTREQMQRPEEGPWYYEQHDLGFNYRMTDFQAALGESQLRKLETFVARRRELASRYDDRLRQLPLIAPAQLPDTQSAWHLYVVRIDHAKRRRVVETLRNEGVYAHVHYIPVHQQPFYARLGFRIGQFPAAEQFYSEAVTLPLHFGLAADEQDFVMGALRQALIGERA